MLTVVDRLTFLQLDPTAAVAPSADLVAWTRLANAYEPFAGRTALLSPFDRLTHDRARALELFDFEYLLEMYKPQAKRRWGYFALPVLHHDQLIGKVDAIADHKTSHLHVHAVHQDVSFTRAMTAAVNAELDALAQWLGLDDVRYA